MAFATRESADARPAGRERDATSFLAILVARSMDSVATAPASAPRDGMDDTAPYVSSYSLCITDAFVLQHVAVIITLPMYIILLICNKYRDLLPRCQ